MNRGNEEERLQLTYAMAKMIPDMRRGFAVHTNYGDIVIDGEDAEVVVQAVSRLLERKLKQLER